MFRVFRIALLACIITIVTFGESVQGSPLTLDIGSAIAPSAPFTHQYTDHESSSAYTVRQVPSDLASPEPSPPPRYAIIGSELVSIRSPSVGVSVTIGVTASFQFSFDIDGILADDLDMNDELFARNILPESVPSFMQLKENYRGGLNVPFLEFLGANINQSVTTADLEAARPGVRRYNRLRTIARRILTRQPIERLRISGRTSVTGTSSTPQTVFSFVRAALVDLTDGSRVLVVSGKSDDIAFASFDGSTALSNATAIHDFKVEPVF